MVNVMVYSDDNYVKQRQFKETDNIAIANYIAEQMLEGYHCKVVKVTRSQ